MIISPNGDPVESSDGALARQLAELLVKAATEMERLTDEVRELQHQVSRLDDRVTELELRK